MTPKEKADELFNNFKIIKYYDEDLLSIQTVYSEKQRAKQCALICVEYLLESHSRDYAIHNDKTYWHPYNYWQEVKQEIKLL